MAEETATLGRVWQVREDLPMMAKIDSPAEVSRVLLLFCVAAGALTSIATKGILSGFAGGFAVGAGTALVFSRLRLRGEAGGPPGGGGS